MPASSPEKAEAVLSNACYMHNKKTISPAFFPHIDVSQLIEDVFHVSLILDSAEYSIPVNPCCDPVTELLQRHCH